MGDDTPKLMSFPSKSLTDPKNGVTAGRRFLHMFGEQKFDALRNYGTPNTEVQ